jgi:hypothetical protein
MNFDTASLNEQYFGFLESDYGFERDKNVLSTQDIQILIQESGYAAGILSSIEVYVWFRDEPKCTRISFDWIAICFLKARLYREESSTSLPRNYQKSSSLFKEYAPRILYHSEEWLVSSMKLHFESMLQSIFRGILQSMLFDRSISEMYAYIKGKDPNWNPV